MVMFYFGSSLRSSTIVVVVQAVMAVDLVGHQVGAAALAAVLHQVAALVDNIEKRKKMNFIKKNSLVVGILAVLVIAIVAFFSIGNGITKEENSVDSAYADIDTQLQRRNDLIPKDRKSI